MSECTWKVGETYKLRDGREAVVLGEHEGRLFGRVKIRSSWTGSDWRADTGFWGDSSRDGVTSSCDLMPPAGPRVKREMWVNAYETGFVTGHSSRAGADSANGFSRVACIRIELDIPEGYGVDKDQPPILVRAG